MATEPVGALRTELSVGHAQFETGLAKAKKSAQDFSYTVKAAMKKVEDSFSSAVTALNRFGGMAAVAAASGLGMMVKKAIDSADELSKMSQKVGISTENLSTLKHAADISGVSLETLGKSMIKLSKNVAEAAEETGDAKDSFSALGISFKNQEGSLKTSDKLLMELADKFKNLPDGVDKTALAVKMFGRSGAELIPMLNMGAAGIKELQDRAKELGLELSTEAGRAAEEFNDQLEDLQKNVDGFAKKIATDALPWLNEWVRIVRMAYDESGLLMAAWVALGGVGEKVFTPTLTQQIEALKKAIEFPSVDPFTGMTENVDALKSKLASLEALKASLDAADKKRFDERRRQEEADAELKEKNAAALRKTLETQKAIEEARKKAAADAAAAHKVSVDLYIKDEAKKWEELDAWNDAYIKQQEKGADILADYANQGRKVFESVMTPLEKYADKLAELDGLLMMGAISFETYTKAGAKALEDLNKEGKDQFEDLKKAIDGWGKDSAAAIVDFTMTGKSSFSDMVNSMIRDILRMIVYQQMTQKAASWVSTGVTAALKWAVSEKGNVFSGGNLVPFARGGVVNRPTIFPMAQGAGLMGEAGPEAILPLTRIGGDLGVKAVGGGDEYHTHVHMNITAWDGRSVTQTLAQHQSQIVGIVNQAYNKMGKRGPTG